MEGRSLDAVAARLKRLREIQPGGLNKTAFAETLNISFNAYDTYECGVFRPILDNALKIIDVYRVTLDWIYDGETARLPQRLYEELYDIRRAGYLHSKIFGI